MLISALLSLCVAFKGADISGENEVKKKEVACAVSGRFMSNDTL